MIPAGVKTGYESEFDFPIRDRPPQQCYLLASVPRSGSTYLSHVLWQSGCLGAPLEYLNFEPAGPSGFAAGEPHLQNNIWREALARRTSPNGIFGLKAFPLQFEELGRQNAELLSPVMRALLGRGADSRVVQLRRRDRLAHTISYARAILSGVWRKEQEAADRPEPDYDARAMERAGRLIESQEGAWQAMYRDLAIRPLELWYEDVVADPHGAVTEVAAYLGVTRDPAAAMAVPAIERQSAEGAKAWQQMHKSD